MKFLSRECPSGNRHPNWVKVCNCRKGGKSLWRYRWEDGKWKPFMSDVSRADMPATSQSSMLSMSGQLTTKDLLIGAIRDGTLVALVIFALAYALFKYTEPQMHKLKAKNTKIAVEQE